MLTTSHDDAPASGPQRQGQEKRLSAQLRARAQHVLNVLISLWQGLKGVLSQAWAPVRAWWLRRSVTFRKIVRTAGLLVVTSVVSLTVGLTTASASSPIGPHTAQWSTTLDSQITLDLGPLGQASLDSPAGLIGVEIVLGEIPSESAQAQVDVSSVGQTLSADASSYLSLVSHPDLTIKAGLRALLAQGLRAAGLIESVLLCLVAAGRLATSGRLRAAVMANVHRGLAASLGAITVTACIAALFIPAVTPRTAAGTTLSVLADTPLQGARLSGRLADVVQAYGPKVRTMIDDNEAFYATAGDNLTAAWKASEQVDGLVDVTVSDGKADLDALEASANARVAKELRTLPTATPSPFDVDATPSSDESPSPSIVAQPQETTTPAESASPWPESTPSATATPSGQLATGPLAVRQRGKTTAVLSTDLHCNLDMIALAGRLDELTGAQIHLDDGDLTMTGSEPEQVCVDALTSAVPRGVARVATIGNHDSSQTAAQLRSRGWTVTDGAVQEVAGLRILGDVDAMRTPAGRNYQRGEENAEQIGQRLAEVSCAKGADVDLVLIHSPYTFTPLISSGCAPLLVAGHSHLEYGMSVSQGLQAPVAQLRAGAGLGDTSVGKIKSDAYLHVLSFDEEGNVLAWRAVVVHTDASVTVGAWQQIPAVGTTGQGASQAAQDALSTS